MAEGDDVRATPSIPSTGAGGEIALRAGMRDQRLFLYHVSQNVNHDRDSYSSFVVAAPDEEIARRTCPSESDYEKWNYDGVLCDPSGEPIGWASMSWVRNLDDVTQGEPMAKHKTTIAPLGTPEADYLPATMAEIMGASLLRALPTLDVVALTCAFGPPVHPGDDSRYGPTWAAKDQAGNTWSVYTKLGTWELSGRGKDYPSKPLVSTTNRFVDYLTRTCKATRV